MAESVPVRCPTCRREHRYSPPEYPCPCGASLTPPLLAGGVPVRVEHRTWDGSWTQVRCEACGRLDDWPQPELGCACGTTLRLPVRPPESRPSAPSARAVSAREPEPGPAPDAAPRPAQATAPGPRPRVRPDARRPAFRPLTIRTADDARHGAALYLRWMGFAGVRVAENRPSSGVDLRGPDVLAHVDPSTTPTPLRQVETLWLNGLNEAATAVCFSLAGYARDARVRADELALPLFVLDLTGTPQPVNDAARELLRSAS